MNDVVYKEMLKIVNGNDSNSSAEIFSEWPESIDSKMFSEVEYLWVEDLLFLRPEQLLSDTVNIETGSFSHDLEVLNISKDNVSDDIMREAFIKSRPYMWLIGQFKNQQATSLQFGKVSALLHNSLLDDPRPYRRAVKDFVAVIFAWIDYLDLENIQIDRHKHSQSVKLL